MGTYSNIRDQRYRTELDVGTFDIELKRAESDRTEESGVRHYIGYRNKLLSDTQYPTSKVSKVSTVAEK